MSSAATHPEPPNLTPELAAKLLDVEHELARLQQTATQSHRWFLLGFIPRLMQFLSILGLCWTFVAAALYLYGQSISIGPTNLPGPWEYAIQLFLTVLGSLFSLVIATWAMRYCQARADGKL
jgi:hypothetical protein